jgi:hypothetical protein
MPRLVFAVLPDGLIVDVLIGLDRATTLAQLAAGHPIGAPISARDEIDTGSNVSAAILQRLGVPIQYQSITQTASGALLVSVAKVSLGIRDSRNPMSPDLVGPTVSVIEMRTPLAMVEVLIGLDFLLGYALALYGVARLHR